MATNDTNTVALKACPFCGWEDTAVYGNEWFVVCEHCGAQGPECLDPAEKASDMWNKRIDE